MVDSVSPLTESELFDNEANEMLNKNPDTV